MKKEGPLVCVCMITYGHEKYIKEAIESVLMQETEFEIELIITNDASPDNTDQIIKNLQKTHPKGNLIKYVCHERNLGAIPTFFQNISLGKGKYLAICEGDDYWTNTKKIQKQVEILESNPQCSACFTNADIIDEFSGIKRNYLKLAENKILKLNEIIEKGGGLFPTASLLFRNFKCVWPDFFLQTRSGDRALSLMLGDKGDFFYLNEKTSVYRLHGGGIFSRYINNKVQRKEITLSNIELLKNFNKFTDKRNDRLFKKAISNLSKKALIMDGWKINYTTIDLSKNLTIKDLLSFLYHSFF